MTIHDAEKELRKQLSAYYDERESATIAGMVMEQVTGNTKIDRLLNRDKHLDAEQAAQLSAYTSALLQHKPVQYVLQEAWFCGMKFEVNESVLIPRPETEELVNWISEEISVHPGFQMLDVGTGSGCIPVALKKIFPRAAVFSCDISEAALAVAARNAVFHQAAVHFTRIDFLDPSSWQQLPEVDLLVSNPPYIARGEAVSMEDHVIRFEPHLALFVDDADPLVFYRAIATFASTHLRKNGHVFVELHERMAKEATELFLSKGFEHIEIKKDMQGKPRMLKATRLL